MNRLLLSTLLAVAALTTVLNAQTEPAAGTWPTWVLHSGNQFRPEPPSAYGDEKNEVEWLKDFAARADENALRQVAYWDAGPPSYRWMQIAMQELTGRNAGPTVSTRAMGLVSATMHDATVATWDAKYTFNRKRPSETDATIVPRVSTPLSPSYPSEHAATAAAAARVLAYLFPERAQVFQSLAEEAGRSRLYAGVQYPGDVIAGLKLGSLVGDLVVEYAKQDGSDMVASASYPPAPGVWGSLNPVTPLAGQWRPWALASGSALRPQPPPAPGTPEMEAQVDGVKTQARNNATIHSAWFWQPSFITPWLETLHREIFENHLDANPPQAARAYALAAIAQHDATIACWDAKYIYLEQRPSMVDSEIVPLFSNPAHPGFPSGHACASGSIAVVLGSLFPADTDSFTAQALDAGMSTFYAGIHTRYDVEVGLALGRAVGDSVTRRGLTGKQ